MSKKTLVIISPFMCRAGYSQHSRLLIKSLLSIPKVTNNFDIGLISTRWGHTPQTALDPNDPEDRKLLELILPNNSITEEPDVSLQISIPSEFQRIGKISIGVTAGTEASLAPLNFVTGVDICDFTIVPSQFTKEVLLGTKYDKKNDQGQIIETLQVTKPIEVLFEGLDLSVFKKIEWI